MEKILKEFNIIDPDKLSVQLENDLSPNSKFGLLSSDDKVFLHSIAKFIPLNGIVVELGVYLGCSSSILAHSNPDIKIYGFDLFDDQVEGNAYKHFKLLKSALGIGQKRTIDNVRKIVSRYSNIQLYKIESGAVIEFNEPIDLFIEDSRHVDPILENHLNLWLPKVKVGGYVLLHDYRPYLSDGDNLKFIDVETHVDKLKNTEQWDFLGSFGDYAVLKKIK